jgi:hypothetical protein
MIQETIVLSLIYIAAVAIAFAPKCPQTVSPDSPVEKIEYFPEIEPVEAQLVNLPDTDKKASPIPQAIAV